MTDKQRGSVRAVKIGNMQILGTDQDFRESPAEEVSEAFTEKLQHKKDQKLKYAKKYRKSTLKNRFDRMKSYYFSKGIDWRLDYEDYKKLWLTAPQVFSREEGQMVDAIDYSDRKGKVRACRKDQLDRVIDHRNICLKHKGKVIHSLI